MAKTPDIKTAGTATPPGQIGAAGTDASINEPLKTMVVTAPPGGQPAIEPHPATMVDPRAVGPHIQAHASGHNNTDARQTPTHSRNEPDYELWSAGRLRSDRGDRVTGQINGVLGTILPWPRGVDELSVGMVLEGPGGVTYRITSLVTPPSAREDLDDSPLP
jgi:hypothetical protein